ncbi:hypothetical protein M408DRAFT_219842 [Serendipita vermifera MAFF 305830]|uniref:Uncharacterized protein n=1 Tax=Serendipita vermifera MAFF 305830 TaxID=933852 RepID=A0A0C3BK87_SERVB|nr:hypothetical protein M408DRAFT_219842 [Serendipita vermifera MAFF 305830]
MLYQAFTCVGVDDKYNGDCSTESANMGSRDGDNDDGITIFDVTDPQNPRYCMVFLGGIEYEEGYDDSMSFRPMSAKTYVESYYPYINPEHSQESQAPEEELDSIRSAYKGLEEVPLIDAPTLAEAFPGEYDADRTEWKWDAVDIAKKSPSSIVSVISELAEETVAAPSLVTITAKKVIESAIKQPEQCHDDLALLSLLTLDLSTVNSILTDLFSLSEIPNPLFPFLAKIVTQISPYGAFVDLSPFPLAAGQIATFAQLFPSCSIMKLGGRNSLNMTAIQAVISSLPQLKVLVLFGKELSVDEIDSLHPTTHIGQPQIAHKLTYFRGMNGGGRRSADMEFVFLLTRKIYSRSSTEAGGCVKLTDPNTIIRAISDGIALLSESSDRATMPQIYFGVGDRTYGSRFATSSLINLTPAPNIPSRSLKWAFILQSTGKPYHRDPWSYGFARCREGKIVDVHDLDGFIEALRVASPELPPVIGYTGKAKECKTPADHGSFYEHLRWVLAPKEKEIKSPQGNDMLVCKLITVDQAVGVIAAFWQQRK